MGTRKPISGMLVALAMAFLYISPAPSLGQEGAGEGRTISYLKEPFTFHRQKYSITTPPEAANASDLSPFLTESGNRFQYEYRFLRDVSESEPPIVLRYRDGAGEGLLGMGWQLRLSLDLSGGTEIDALTPVITPHETGKGWFLQIATERVAVSRTEEEGKVIYVTRSSDGRQTYRFLQVAAASLARVVPFEIHGEGKSVVRFEYEIVGDVPVLCRLVLKSGVLSLQFGQPQSNSSARKAREGSGRAKMGRLERMVLTRDRASDPALLAQWEMTYATDKALGMTFLTRVALEPSGGPKRNLRFSYGVLDQRAVGGKRRHLKGARTSMWKLVENDPRFVLPDRMSIATSPGLRFMDLNQDGFTDLVDTQDRTMNSWLWNPRANRWENFNKTYKPPRPSVWAGRLTGSHYSGLYKKYFKDQKEIFNTVGFQSFAVSYYKPGADQKNLDYRSCVCFPRVPGGVITPDPETGKIWDCDDHPLLRLPIPLQYEGEDSWPDFKPGIAKVENSRNQGAQFVQFTQNERPNLFYIGLRYRDAKTGEVLPTESAHHRDTGNCVERYETVWEQVGLARKVKVEICQAFWVAADKFWSERYPISNPGKPFWVRADLGADDKPTGLYILPWNKDPNYHAHYESFRSVTFATLDNSADIAAFAIVQGRAIPNSGPEGNRPEAKDIYGLISGSGQWKRLDPESGYYPPDEFFENFNGVFADVDGDDRDDAILATGEKRKTWLNTGGTPRWKDAPEFYLPRECNLGNGNCRFLKLNGDEYQDLLIGSGRRVYINQAGRDSRSYLRYMTSFTDENWQQKSVSQL